MPNKMTFSMPIGVTVIKPHDGRPMGWRIDVVTGEQRPLTTDEIAAMAAFDERVRVHTKGKRDV
jgi:hypothetical protein